MANEQHCEAGPTKYTTFTDEIIVGVVYRMRRVSLLSRPALPTNSLHIQMLLPLESINAIRRLYMHRLQSISFNHTWFIMCACAQSVLLHSVRSTGVHRASQIDILAVTPSYDRLSAILSVSVVFARQLAQLCFCNNFLHSLLK